MRERQGARVVLLDVADRVLLLHFAYATGPLAGTDYWGLPGGGIEPGESPDRAAERELFEETGLRAEIRGEPAGESRYPFRLATGEDVLQHDHYFVVRLAPEDRVPLSRDGLTPEESGSLDDVRWWNRAEIATTRERVIPEGMLAVLDCLPGVNKE